MKKWKMILGSVLALLVLVVTPLSIMAAGQDTATTAPARVHLAIVQPWAVPVGQNMQLTVFERTNQTPIADAGVWTITKDKIDIVRQQVRDLVAKGAAKATEKDFEDILNANATKLGQTDSTGKLTKTFDTPIKFWLVALKDGFLPGYSHLNVTEVLTISAPKTALPGDQVKITVDQKGTTTAVSGANVWAIDFSNAKTLKDKMAELRKANKGDLQSANWAGTLSSLAISLGTTDASGQVTHSFDKGRYLLIATVKGCAPTYTGIVIATPKPTSSPTVTPSTPSVTGTVH